MTYESGKRYFRTYCSSCHSAHQEIYGPMLGSISKKRSVDWLIAFIQNSQAVIQSGDPYAKTLFEKFNNQVMPPFTKLAEKDIKAILYYLQYESAQPSEYLNDTDISHTNNSNIVKGKQEFLEHCATCHFIHKESDFAPALGSVTKRHDKTWIISFIHNSQNVIKGGDPYAENLYLQFDQHVMTSMDFLSYDEINSILDYIEFASTVNVTYTDNTVAVTRTTNKKSIRHITNKAFMLIFAVFVSVISFVYYLLKFNNILKK